MNESPWFQKATLPVSVKLRNDYVDFDYLGKLNADELKWLKGFSREYYNADFQHKFKKHFKSKKKKREMYSKDNALRRDLYTVYKTCNKLGTIDCSGTLKDKSMRNLLYSEYGSTDWDYPFTELKTR